MTRYTVAGVPFPTKDAIRDHIRAVRDRTPLGAEIDDDVVLWLLHRHPQWDEKSQGMTFVGTAMIQGSPAAPARKEIAILRGDLAPMDISWTKLLARLQRSGSLNHPSESEECLAELRIAGRQEVEDQLAPRRAAGLHLDHAHPMTYEQLLYDWVVQTGLNLQQIIVESNDGPVVKRWLRDRDLARSWQEHHQRHAVYELLTLAAHAAKPQLRIDWSLYLRANG